MAAPVDFIRIRSAWDRTLTYDSLDRAGGLENDDAIFVGREHLLDPLIEAIADPQTRGTFLISGYRGAGKTTLLIEALRRAKVILEGKREATSGGSEADALRTVAALQASGDAGAPTGWRLMPLVLNVSELSASLPASSAQDAPSLVIDPRRLLTALLRALMNRAGLLPDEHVVRAKIVETYNKANAAEYSRTTNAERDEARSIETETTLSFEVKDLYRLFGALAAGGVVVLESIAWLGPTAAAMHAVALILAGASIASFRFSQKQTRREAERRELKTSLRFDNSLHQIETDLKDILGKLHAHGLRPVVVLEELDKLDDGEGKQLDAVIRYFKNLFTQAPGLFFFVTDKGYFDLVSSRIKTARRSRSYAVEHTFFTHRIFVGRPSTADCVSYLQRIAAQDPDHERVAQYGGALLVSRSAGNSGDRLLMLIGAVLFRAANHLFDLKNELRPYVRRIAVGDVSETRLTFDSQSLTDDEAAQAKLQALIEMKARQYAFGPGRPYANEVLNDCLYAVFNELGSSRPQTISDFFPRQPSDLLLDEQLDVTEVERIKDAVISLADDLQRGAAFARDRKDLAAGQFVWSPAAARGFRFVRRLEAYEEEFVSELSRLATRARRFGKTGPFAAVEGIVDADAVAQAIEDRIGQIRDLTHSLGFEDAEIEKLGFADRVHQAVDRAFAKLLQRLQSQYGLPVRTRQTQGAQGVYVIGAGADALGRASATDTGAMLLVLGEAPEAEATVRSLIATAFGVERLALVHVIDDRGQTGAVDDGLQKWNKLFSTVAAEFAGSQPPLAMPNWRVRVIALGEPYVELELNDMPHPTLEHAWGEHALCEIMFEAPWVNPVWPRLGSLAALRAGRVPATHAGLIAAFDQWLSSSDRLFQFKPLPTDEPALAAPAGELESWLERRDAPDVFVVNVFSATEAPFASSSVARLRIAQHLHASFRDMQASEATFERAAAIGVVTRRLIPGIHLPDVQKADAEALQGLRALLGPSGRLVLASDTLPAVFSDMSRQEHNIASQPDGAS